MPFQSEKQRRYLWANEPEIARDWTNTYGSGIAKALGGRIPFAEGSGKTSIPEWNLAILKTALETATSDEERAEIQSQIDTVEGDIGTTADTLLGSGEAPTKGMGSKLLEFIFGGPAEGSIPTEQERIALINSMQAPETRGPREMFEMAARPREGLASIGPHGWEFGNQWQTPEQQKGGNWLSNIASFLPFVGKNTRTGAFMRMLRNQFMPDGGITSMFNRPTTPQQRATQRFMQNYNVGRNPTTGRMIGGPFAGRNLPGTSMFGSKTPQEMAQNWMKKHGSRQYNTERQMAKQKEIRDIAAGNTNLPPSERTGDGGSGNAGGATSRPDRGRSRETGQTGQIAGGHHFNRGGLAGLWPR
jgi:hypothetical protein